jgi:energy-coupling factor transport system ATP-binding protein
LFIQTENLSYRHAGIAANAPSALNGVSLSIDEGEWVAIIGANGSGKTTLARHLNGLLQPTGGHVLVAGLDTRKQENLPQIRSLVGMVFQSPEDQIVSSLVLEDTAFGPENLSLPTAQIRQRVENALNVVGMWKYREKPPHLLSAGQIQRVALAGVLAMEPRCIIFDETTAMLDPYGRQVVLEQMNTLHMKGITILMITHSMDEAVLADRIVVLNVGELAADGSPADIFSDAALLKRCHLEPPATLRMGEMVNRHFSLALPALTPLDDILASIPQNPDAGTNPSSHSHHKKQPADGYLCVTDLHHTYMAGSPFETHSLQGISLTTSPGRIHGLVGATGSGKSTLLQHLNGLYLPQSGSVRVGSYDLNDPKLDIRALRRYVGIVFQNPEAFFFENYVGDEIAFGPKQLYGREGLRERVQKAMEQVGLDFETFKDRSPLSLSGGEKRKVALASALAMQPGLLVLDEPGAGLDPFSRQTLINTLRMLHKEGLEIVLSTHNMDEIAELADEVTLLKRGRVLASGPVSEIFAKSELMTEAKLVQPPAIKLAAVLRSKGWDLTEECITFSGIERFLSKVSKRGAK